MEVVVETHGGDEYGPGWAHVQVVTKDGDLVIEMHVEAPGEGKPGHTVSLYRDGLEPVATVSVPLRP